MAKDRTEDPEKKEKKSRKSIDGVSKSHKKEKKDKKDKKEKKQKNREEQPTSDAVAGADEDVEMGGTGAAEVAVNGEDEVVKQLVPFADPMATAEETKKILDGVKRASRNRALLTGIKETQKSLRRSSTAATAAPRGILILAADTYPWDIISHMPVLCEDHNTPYIFVRSREELGQAGGSVRMQTSAMMVLAEKGVKKAAKEGEAAKEAVPGELSAEEYKKAYEKLLKVVNKAQDRVKL
ncbi:L30e-like protein [Eremomyces bilateralis CBS 781.70]|uniref:L30e-like protein n=1 Tax=Eremomyces bilateralis CBS 781.70 TaxID=1392243 RepID=A0A6G1G9X9_9PEZI|nr:L30e-like protein [Eremomyces bilateralis CBS 781.70]KAF1814887.1 L30e-like protein [Eremomyces bilateralis CBS 781.70]